MKGTDEESLPAVVDTTDPLTYMVYGGPPDPLRDNAERVVENRWGITIRSVAGCTPREADIIRARTNNAVVEPIIARRFGSDWRTRFHEELSVEIKIQKRILRLIDSTPVLKRREEQLRSEDNVLLFKLDPISGTTWYLVHACSYGTDRYNDPIVTQFTLQVDPESGRIDSLKAFSPPLPPSEVPDNPGGLIYAQAVFRADSIDQYYRSTSENVQDSAYLHPTLR